MLRRRDGLIALTLGAEGPCCSRTERRSPAPTPPRVQAVDGTAAGDAFTACLLVSLLEGRDARGGARRACAAGALAASRFGAQPSLPTAAEVDAILARVSTPIILDCDPGHDDAIALLLALASPEIELVGVTTTHGNQTLEKTTDNALRVLALAGPARTSPSPRAPTVHCSASCTSPRTSTARAGSTGRGCRTARPSRSGSTPSTSSPSA